MGEDESTSRRAGDPARHRNYHFLPARWENWLAFVSGPTTHSFHFGHRLVLPLGHSEQSQRRAYSPFHEVVCYHAISGWPCAVRFLHGVFSLAMPAAFIL